MIFHDFGTKSPFNSIEDIRGKKILVMGLGLNGGGLAAAKFFARHGAEVKITDKKSERELAPSIEQIRGDEALDAKKISFILGRHEIADFQACDAVIKNPGVKFDGNEFLEAAEKCGAAIESDISVFLRLCASPVVAITGSKGKSSTASAIDFGFRECGISSFLGGNITVSPLTFLEKTSEKTPVVLELSSWQLSDLRGRGILRPKVAVVTKIVPDHQNWYGNMQDYVADKKLIFADQSGADWTLLFEDGEWSEVFARETAAKVLRYGNFSFFEKNAIEGAFLRNGEGFFRLFGKESCAFGKNLRISGEHFKENLLAAALTLRIFGAENEKIARALSKFGGIEHRLEHFWDWKNENGASFRFFNDSAATVPQALVAAVNSFERPFLICGGTDKGLDFSELSGIAEKCARIYFLQGSATEKMAQKMKGMRGEIVNCAGFFSSLEDLVRAVKSELRGLKVGGTVVFSPGATSFGMFQNEFDRGRKFKKNIEEFF